MANRTPDPMLEAVTAYGVWLKAYADAPFKTRADEEAWLAANPDDAGNRLHKEPPMPTTRAGALSAIRFVMEDHDHIQKPHAAILGRALSFLEAPASQPDPCFAFVNDWNAALAENEAIANASETNADPDAQWVAKVMPFFDLAKNGKVPPATTAEGAAAVLCRMLDWDDIEDQDANMIRAALAYLDAGGRPAAPVQPDPLLAIVQRYRAQLAEFNKITGKTDEEANAIRDATWGAFEDGVADGSIILPSPTTLIGAAAALRCALEEDTTHEVSDKMRDVALAFLEAEGIQ